MKQETLEEAAKSHAIYELENNYKPTKESFKLACKRNFIRGAKWQAERMYSEEDMLKFAQKYSVNTLDKSHIEKFKKK